MVHPSPQTASSSVLYQLLCFSIKPRAQWGCDRGQKRGLLKSEKLMTKSPQIRQLRRRISSRETEGQSRLPNCVTYHSGWQVAASTQPRLLLPLAPSSSRASHRRTHFPGVNKLRTSRRGQNCGASFTGSRKGTSSEKNKCRTSIP